MTNLKDLNLHVNPFKNFTPSKDEKLIWADMRDVKAKIEKSYKDCLNNDSKQIVLNWGQYGGGKTFSAYFFEQEYLKNGNITQIYVRCPKDGPKATDEFFKAIVDYLTFDLIRERIKNIISERGEEELMKFLTPKTSREYAKAICLIGSDDDEISQLMNRFLYVGLTKTELKKLGLAKDIQTDSDTIKFLSGILSCFIGDKTIGKRNVVLWIDEMEDLIYYAPKNYKAFSQVLRDLLDNLSERLLVFFNFTLAEGEETTIELILGGAVWSRINKKIRFKPFTLDNGLNYVKELLNAAKIKKDNAKPLPDSIIMKVMSMIPISNLTPREINKHFTSLINYAMDNGIKEISEKTFNSWVVEFAED
jgi:hypothetical protein